MKMYKSTLNRVMVIHGEKQEVFVPTMVEKCMNPGTYTTYPVEIYKDDKGNYVVKDLNHSMTYPKDTLIEESRVHLEKPGRSGCDGNCEECRKCS